MRKEFIERIIESNIIVLFFAWVIYSIFFGEIIPATNGLGWDGVHYSMLAQQFPSDIMDHKLSSYSVHRILPSGLIYLTSKILNFSVNDKNIPFIFSILNATMLAVSVLTWRAIAKKLKWSPQVRIISFAGLFLNYVNLKMNFYYPALTDTTAMAIGFLMLYFYIIKNNKCLLAVSVVGAFTFPTLLYVGLILFMFPINTSKEIALKKSRPFSSTISFLQALIITGVCIALHFKYGMVAMGSNYSLPVIFLSSFAVFIYVFLSFKCVIQYYLSILYSFIRIDKLFFAVVTILLVALATNLIAGTEADTLTFCDYLINISNQAIAYPFNFIISHTMYYGPIILLLICFWRDIVEFLARKGLGIFVVTCMYIVLSLGSESRQLINFLPIAVFIVAEVLNKKTITWNFTIFFTLLSLAISKFWLPLNHGEWPSLITSPPEITLQFPLQWYFMSQGPWVSHTMYLVHLTITWLAFFCVYLTSKKIRTDSPCMLSVI